MELEAVLGYPDMSASYPKEKFLENVWWSTKHSSSIIYIFFYFGDQAKSTQVPLDCCLSNSVSVECFLLDTKFGRLGLVFESDTKLTKPCFA